jgi:hypothetical protein
MNLTQFFTDIEALGPVLLTAINPGLGLIASGVVGLVKAAEVTGADGPTKLASVEAAAPALITDINTGAGKTVVDPTLVTIIPSAVSQVIQAIKLIRTPGALPAVTAALATPATS